MTILATSLMVVCGLVWFFSKWSENLEEAARLKKLDELEEAAYQREKAYFEGLRAKAAAGDRQTAALCRSFGWHCD